MTLNEFLTCCVGIGMLYALSPRREAAGIAGMEKSTFKPPYDGACASYADTKGKSGVYLIKESGTVVYIGHSKSNLYKTLYRHFQKWNHPFQQVTTYKNRDNYTVRVILCTPSQAVRLEAYLVNRYQPRDNDNKLKLYAETDTGKTEFQKLKDIEPSF